MEDAQAKEWECQGEEDVVSGKRIRRNRPIERATVNAVRAFLDKHNIPFMEVPFDVDYGKDMYVELAREEAPSGRVIALQLKGGEQTFRKTQGVVRRGLPYSRDDAHIFRESNIPVIGMVNDAEHKELLWVNLTALCKSRFTERGDDSGGFAEASNRLNDYHLSAFLDDMRLLTHTAPREIALDLASDNVDRQLAALIDCFGLGRRDARPLLLVRRTFPWLQDVTAIAVTIEILAHLVPHGDILYHPRNTVMDQVAERVRAEMVFTRDEMQILLGHVEDEGHMWGRGTFGQHIVMLILSRKENGRIVYELAVDQGASFKVRRRAFVLATYLASYRDDRDAAERLFEGAADLLSDEILQDIVATYRESGYFSLF